MHWNTAAYKCFDNKGFYGDWHTVYAAGKLELRVKDWGCQAANRYDPTKWKSLYQPTPTPAQ